jgi:tetratricopeptide (TPR) repeat protein
MIALLGRLSEAKEMAPRGIEAARAGKSDSDLTFALCGVADLECMSGRIDKGEEIALEALEVAEKAGMVFGQIYALTQLARVRNVVGKWRESIEVSELAADLIRRYGTGLESEPRVLCDLGAALMGAGRLDDARATLDEALDLARRRQARLAELGLYSVCAHLEIVMHGAQSGARVEELLAKADRLIVETGAILVRPSVFVERARFAELSGDNEGRDRYYREAERLFAEYGATGFAAGVREKLAESG